MTLAMMGQKSIEKRARQIFSHSQTLDLSRLIPLIAENLLPFINDFVHLSIIFQSSRRWVDVSCVRRGNLRQRFEKKPHN
jgi:hypothetical protein